MESLEKITRSKNDQTRIKGKRTKRQRPWYSFGMAMTSNSSSGGSDGGGSGGGGGDGDGGGCQTSYSFIPSPTTSASTEEDQNMANCLILLAQGEYPKQINEMVNIEKFSYKRLAEMVTTTTSKGGFNVYECKTCNRAFPSFQALGGHRASHKKSKAMAMAMEEKKVVVLPLENNEDNDHGERQFNKIRSPLISVQITTTKEPKIHECLICGVEFSSGQALGGHMRRHRSAITDQSSNESDNKPRNILSLDLNLPAPEDDHDSESKFHFTSNQSFFAPALVDCQY